MHAALLYLTWTNFCPAIDVSSPNRFGSFAACMLLLPMQPPTPQQYNFPFEVTAAVWAPEIFQNTKKIHFFWKQRFILMVLNHDLFVRDKIKHEQKRKKEVPSVFMKPGLRRSQMQYSPKLSDPQETSTIKIGVRALPPSLLNISKIEKHVSIDPTRPCIYT